MRPRYDGNIIIKYADDIISATPLPCNSHTCFNELRRIQSAAGDNDLRQNTSKSREITFRARGYRARGKSEQSPLATTPACIDIERVTQLTAVGVYYHHSYYAI